MGRIVITGASGHYGRLATPGLIERGRAADLILMSRTPAKLADMAALGCEVRYGDYDLPESMVAAMAGAERLLLISGTRVGARVAQQQAHHVQVAPTARLVQRGVAELVHHTHVSTTLQQQLDDGEVVVHGRVVQRGAAILQAGGAEVA